MFLSDFLYCWDMNFKDRLTLENYIGLTHNFLSYLILLSYIILSHKWVKMKIWYLPRYLFSNQSIFYTKLIKISFIMVDRFKMFCLHIRVKNILYVLTWYFNASKAVFFKFRWEMQMCIISWIKYHVWSCSAVPENKSLENFIIIVNTFLKNTKIS